MSDLPTSVRRGIEEALSSRAGHAVRVVRTRGIGGGCINPSVRLETDGGESWFAKWNRDAPAGAFAVEAEGLGALREAGAPAGVRVPEVAATGGDEDGAPWLLLEYVAPGSSGGGGGEALGRGLAGLHRAGADEPTWGWRRDNFIGPLPQANGPAADWASFWRDRRLVPQLERARREGYFQSGDGRDMERVVTRVEDALAGAERDGPSLLHGDLWSGNVFPDEDGRPVLVDPAVYRGHREVDLAMSELFGGFPHGFLDAYEEAWPLDAAYRRVRRPLYQLYYLLVHVNLFGAGYVSGSLGAARSVIAAVG